MFKSVSEKKLNKFIDDICKSIDKKDMSILENSVVIGNSKKVTHSIKKFLQTYDNEIKNLNDSLKKEVKNLQDELDDVKNRLREQVLMCESSQDGLWYMHYPKDGDLGGRHSVYMVG